MSYEPGGSYRQLWADSASKRAFKLGLTLYHCAEPNHEDDNQYPDDDTFILVNGAVDSGVVDAETIERLLDELEIELEGYKDKSPMEREVAKGYVAAKIFTEYKKACDEQDVRELAKHRAEQTGEPQVIRRLYEPNETIIANNGNEPF